jgi:hypothetical protein
MNSFFRNNLQSRGVKPTPLVFGRGALAALLAITLLSSTAFVWQGSVASAKQQTGAATATKPATTLSEAEKKATARVKLESIREITTKLASKEFEGRGTGQPGADKAAAYLADRFAKFGLKPAGENGTYLQQIKFKTSEFLPETSVKVGDVQLKLGADYVVAPPYTTDKVDLTGGLVFAGLPWRRGIDHRERRYRAAAFCNDCKLSVASKSESCANDGGGSSNSTSTSSSDQRWRFRKDLRWRSGDVRSNFCKGKDG